MPWVDGGTTTALIIYPFVASHLAWDLLMGNFSLDSMESSLQCFTMELRINYFVNCF